MFFTVIENCNRRSAISDNSSIIIDRYVLNSVSNTNTVEF